MCIYLWVTLSYWIYILALLHLWLIQWHSMECYHGSTPMLNNSCPRTLLAVWYTSIWKVKMTSMSEKWRCLHHSALVSRNIISCHVSHTWPASGPLFTKRLYVMPSNLVQSRSREGGYHNDRIALKFDRHHGSAAAKIPEKTQID